MSKDSLVKFVLGVGAAATIILGYCIYIDRQKRRTEGIKQADAKKKSSLEAERKEKEKVDARSKVPDLRDPGAIERFLLEEAQLAERLLMKGVEDEGMEHLSNVVVFSGKSDRMMELYQQTLPPRKFQMLISKLADTTRKLSAAMEAQKVSIQ